LSRELPSTNQQKRQEGHQLIPHTLKMTGSPSKCVHHPKVLFHGALAWDFLSYPKKIQSRLGMWPNITIINYYYHYSGAHIKLKPGWTSPFLISGK